jgi:hypothetical protein
VEQEDRQVIGAETASRELVALREVLMIGYTADHEIAEQLAADDLLSETSEGFFQLTSAGQLKLVRDAPMFWSARID